MEKTGYEKAGQILAFGLLIGGLALAAVCGGLATALWLVTH